jgi:uncharacterized iron-regulated membrane protein
LANGREGWPALGLLLYFFLFLNRTGSVWFGLAGSGTSKQETGPDIFLNILIASIGFFYRFGFFG